MKLPDWLPCQVNMSLPYLYSIRGGATLLPFQELLVVSSRPWCTWSPVQTLPLLCLPAADQMCWSCVCWTWRVGPACSLHSSQRNPQTAAALKKEEEEKERREGSEGRPLITIRECNLVKKCCYNQVSLENYLTSMPDDLYTEECTYSYYSQSVPCSEVHCTYCDIHITVEQWSKFMTTCTTSRSSFNWELKATNLHKQGQDFFAWEGKMYTCIKKVF